LDGDADAGGRRLFLGRGSVGDHLQLLNWLERQCSKAAMPVTEFYEFLKGNIAPMNL